MLARRDQEAGRGIDVGEKTEKECQRERRKREDEHARAKESRVRKKMRIESE